MNLQERIGLLVQLGKYMSGDALEWQEAKEKANRENAWFTPEFIELAVNNITELFLQDSVLQQLAKKYQLPEENHKPKKVGIVMAGNIPMVGFHDLLCTFLSGHYAAIKLSSKDNVLIPHLVDKMIEWQPDTAAYLSVQELLKGCDAYIATGSNNSARYFEHYFSKYPHIIRKNRTSVAVIEGNETKEQLDKLADDVHQYFGLGCRNVTKIYVPADYDFKELLNAFSRYNYLSEHNKYKNNYDYNLAMHILNNKFFMSTESVLLIEDSGLFSRIGQLHYEYYTDKDKLAKKLENNEEIQCVVGEDNLDFGAAQCPAIDNFADGVDTLQFLTSLN